LSQVALRAAIALKRKIMVEIIAVSIPEAAKMCGLGRSSIYKLLDEGKLKKRKLGKRTLILVSEIHEYLENLPSS